MELFTKRSETNSQNLRCGEKNLKIPLLRTSMGQRDAGDANLLVQQFSNVFSQVIGKHAPLRQIRVSEIYCPWINSDSKNLIRTRDRFKRSAAKHKSQHLMN